MCTCSIFLGSTSKCIAYVQHYDNAKDGSGVVVVVVAVIVVIIIIIIIVLSMIEE